MGRRIAADGSIGEAQAPAEPDACGPAWYAAVPLLGFLVSGVQGLLFGALISGFLWYRGCPAPPGAADAAAPTSDRHRVRGLADLPQPAPARGG